MLERQRSLSWRRNWGLLPTTSNLWRWIWMNIVQRHDVCHLGGWGEGQPEGEDLQGADQDPECQAEAGRGSCWVRWEVCAETAEGGAFTFFCFGFWKQKFHFLFQRWTDWRMSWSPSRRSTRPSLRSWSRPSQRCLDTRIPPNCASFLQRYIDLSRDALLLKCQTAEHSWWEYVEFRIWNHYKSYESQYYVVVNPVIIWILNYRRQVHGENKDYANEFDLLVNFCQCKIC